MTARRMQNKVPEVTLGTSVLFLATILALVVLLTITRRDRTELAVDREPAPV